MANKFESHGATLKRATTAIASIENLEGPNMVRPKIQTTTLDTPDRTHTYLPGITDPGEIRGLLVWDPADAEHAQLIDDLTGANATKAPEAFSIEYTIGAQVATLSFDAFVSTGTPRANLDNRLEMDAVFTVSGPVGLAVAP